MFTVKDLCNAIATEDSSVKLSFFDIVSCNPIADVVLCNPKAGIKVLAALYGYGEIESFYVENNVYMCKVYV